MDRQELLERYTALERDFSGIDLSGADLEKLNLAGINLSGANLRETNLFILMVANRIIPTRFFFGK